MKRLACALSVILPLWGCTEAAPPEARPVGLANPAAAYCVESGGKVVVSGTPGGDAMCQLPDGRKVGEWEYYNEHHQPEPASVAPMPEAA